MVTPAGSRGRSRASRVTLLLATGFHLGRVPYAPGTAGSLAAFLVFLAFRHQPWTVHLAVLVLLFAVGTYTAHRAEKLLAGHDPSMVVIDEIVGCWAALLQISPSPAPLLAAFVLYRVFDIWKPFPVGLVERLPGGWGIMLDDLVAAIYANLSVRLLVRWLPGVIG